MRIRNLLLVAILLGSLFTHEALASVSAARINPQTKPNSGLIEMNWAPTIAAIANTAIDTCIINVAPYVRPWILPNTTSSLPYISYALAADLTAAADSLNTALDVGPSDAGPWKEIYASNLNARTLYNATPYFMGNISTATLPFMPYWRIRVKNKSTTAWSGKKIRLFFPVVSGAQRQ